MLRTKVLWLVWAVAAAAACDPELPLWIPQSRGSDALYRFEKGGTAGYINAQGRIVIPARRDLTRAGEFHDGVAELGRGTGRYVDASGKIVLQDANLQQARQFSEGLAPAMRRGEDEWGYIDREGHFAIEPRFKGSPNGDVWPFEEGLARVEVNNQFGFINHAGDFAIAVRFQQAEDFSGGLARVVIDGPCRYYPEDTCDTPVYSGTDPAKASSCKFTFVDKSGKPISSERYDFARQFSEGLAPVERNGRWGFIDPTGKLVIPYRFVDAYPFSEGLARVRVNDSWGYIDHQGKIVIAPWYEFASNFAGNRAMVGNSDEGYWYINTSGEEAFEERFLSATPFYNGLAHVQILESDEEGRPTYAYINKAGQHIFSYQR